MTRVANPYQQGLDRFYPCALWLPTGSGANEKGFGPAWVPVAGGAIALAAITTGPVNQLRRTQFPCNAINQTLGIRYDDATARVYRSQGGGGGGFYFSATFSLEAWTGTSRIFVGLANTTAGAVAGANLAGQAGQSIGLYRDENDTGNTLSLLVNGTVAATKLAPLTIKNGGAIIGTGQGFRFEMWAFPHSLLTYARLCSLNPLPNPPFDPAVNPAPTPPNPEMMVLYWQSFDGPTVNTMIQPAVQMNSGPNNAAAVTLGVMNALLQPR